MYSEEDIDSQYEITADLVSDSISSLEYHECENHKYYLGSYLNVPSENTFITESFYNSIVELNIGLEKWYLMGTRIPIEVLYKYPIHHIHNYLSLYALTRLEVPKLHILQTININPSKPYEIWGIVIKTHWLRLIQRTWKRVYKERIYYYKNLKNLYYREIKYKYAPLLPSLRGMLSMYSHPV